MHVHLNVQVKVSAGMVGFVRGFAKKTTSIIVCGFAKFECYCLWLRQTQVLLSVGSSNASISTQVGLQFDCFVSTNIVRPGYPPEL